MIQPSLVKCGSEEEHTHLRLPYHYFLYEQSATRSLGAEISTGKLRTQDTSIRNMLVTGKISEQFPWLKPKSSDFALELPAPEKPKRLGVVIHTKEAAWLQVLVLWVENALPCANTHHGCSPRVTAARLGRGWSCCSTTTHHFMLFWKLQEVGTGEKTTWGTSPPFQEQLVKSKMTFTSGECAYVAKMLYFFKWSLFKQLKHTPTPYASMQVKKSLLYIMHSTSKWHLLSPWWKITVSICI